MLDPRYEPLLTGVSQFEVDFVVPRVGVDVPLGIDPFLLYKSRNPDFTALHEQVLKVFNAGIMAVREDRLNDARYIFDFPEVSEIGLGNAKKQGRKGSGVGIFLSELIIETLRSAPALVSRGIRHIEEMQLVSVGIGPDRISDITANIIKSFLIDYTQKQAALWKLPVVPGVPVSHILNIEDMEWHDGHFDLPISLTDQKPILLVPRRLVRSLPWINYDDFFRLEFAAYLKAKKIRRTLLGENVVTSPLKLADKNEIVTLVRSDLVRIDRYIAAKERDAVGAQPAKAYLGTQADCEEVERLKARLMGIPTGRESASEYQQAVLSILNFLFNPELIDGELEVKTIDGTERRDIMYTNDSDQNFWEYVRTEHSGIFLMFETKNMIEIEAPAFNQTATYLGDRIGRLGIIVTRNPNGESQIRKAHSIFNDSHPRKVILVVADKDLNYMLDMKCKGNDPTTYIQQLYRKFRTSIQ